MSLERLPHVNLSPRLYLHDLLEIADDMESICAIVKRKDGTYRMSWTVQPISSLSMCLAVALHDIPQVIKGAENYPAPQQPEGA